MNGYKLTPQWMEDGIVRDFSEAANLDHLFVRAVDGDKAGGGSLLDLLVKAGETTKADDGAITTRFVASTADVDRMGDVVDQATWRLGAWRSNPVILYEHHYDPVVGRGVGKVAEGEAAKRLEIAVRWDTSELNPKGMLAAHQHQNGFRSAGSVGFRPGKVLSRTKLPKEDPRRVDPEKTSEWRAGYVFSHNELLEFSTVAVPANAAALQLSLYAREADDPSEQVRRFVAESTDAGIAEAIMRAVNSSAELRSVLQANAWGASLKANGSEGHPLDHLLQKRSA